MLFWLREWTDRLWHGVAREQGRWVHEQNRQRFHIAGVVRTAQHDHVRAIGKIEARRWNGENYMHCFGTHKIENHASVGTGFVCRPGMIDGTGVGFEKIREDRLAIYDDRIFALQEALEFAFRK